MACPPLCGYSQRHLQIEVQFQEDLTSRDRLALGAMTVGAVGGGALLGRVAGYLLGGGGGLLGASPMLPAVPSAMAKLNALGEKFGMSAGQLANQTLTQGRRMLDAANGGNVNAIIPRVDGASGFIRVTLDPSQTRIISAGLQTTNQVSNGLGNGRFHPLQP